MANTKVPVELSSTPSIVDNGNATAIAIDSSENVGIGETSPEYQLHIAGGGDLLVEDTGNGSAHIRLRSSSGGVASSNWKLKTGSNNFFYIDNDTGSAGTAIAIDNNGNVGIGETSPDKQLHIKDSGAVGIAIESTDNAQNLDIDFYNNVGSVQGRIRYAEGAGTFGFAPNASATDALHILYNGNVGIGTSSPTEKLTVNGAILASGALQDDRTSTAAMDFSSNVTRFVSYGASGVGGQFAFRTAGGGASSAERVRINYDGYVGIGTTSPAMILDVDGSSAANDVARFSGANSGGLTFRNATSNEFIIHTATSDALIFGTNGNNERMRILSDGDVIIGGTFLADDGSLSISPNHDDGACVVFFDRASTTATSDVIRFENGGSTVGQIRYNSSSVNYDTSSDYRLKENVDYEFDALDRVVQLKPARFNFISDPDKTVDGFLAHEVSDIVPEAISGEKDGVDEEGNPKYQGIDQSKLVPLLTKAIIEQQELINNLTARIEQLEK